MAVIHPSVPQIDSTRPRKAKSVSAKSAAAPFQKEFHKFFKDGLGPTLSTNQSTSRTDVVIEAETLNAALDSRRILDVCCGWSLFLQNLIEQLRDDPQRTPRYHYVACDMNISSDDYKWLNLVGLAKQHKVKLSLITTNVGETSVLRSALHAKARGKFDLILFSNALHEISPSRIPQLLFTLVDLLSDKGQLVVIDPEPDWLLHPERWSALGSLKELAVDWEANAVWLPASTYRSILRLFGCTVKSSVIKKYQHFYSLHAHRKSFEATKRKELVKKATALLKRALDAQLKSEIKRYADCREELKNQLFYESDIEKSLLYKAVEFCAICASQAKRVEAAEQLTAKRAK